MKQIISLFSGCGGLDLGFEMAGFRPIVAYDIFDTAVTTYNTNRDQKRIARCADLTRLDSNEIIFDTQNELTNGIPIGVIGGPPCQVFSRSNVKPRKDDVRRTLPGRYAQLLSELNKQYPIHFFVFDIAPKKWTQSYAHFLYSFSSYSAGLWYPSVA